MQVMIRLVLVTAPILSLLFALMLIGIHLQSPTSAAVTTVFGVCAMPCWQGVQPGVTSRENALALLTDMNWQANTPARCTDIPFDQCDTYYLTNPTNPRQIAQVNVDQEGVDGVILTSTEFTLGEALAMFGQPDRGSYQMEYNLTHHRFAFWVWFDRVGVGVRTFIGCPAAFHDLLRAPVTAVTLRPYFADPRPYSTEIKRMRMSLVDVCGR
jgi:hypothetical protein